MFKMANLRLVIMAVFLALVHLRLTTGQRRRVDNRTRIPVEIVDDEQRLVNWCVTGVDEPEFGIYPFNEFVPYLQKTHQTLVRARDRNFKPRYDYQLNLVDVRYVDDAVGVRGALLNTAHLKFTVFKLRPSALGVKEVLQPKMIEGLVIQVNHAPLGIGMPFAKFVLPEEEVVCFDCGQPQGVPIGCRKRTYHEIVHPTIMAYHHRMQITQEEISRKKEYIQYQRRKQGNVSAGATVPPIRCEDLQSLGPKYCDFENLGLGGGVVQMDQGVSNEIHGTLVWYFPPCTVSRAIEFIVLVVHSFTDQDYDIFFLGPYLLPDIARSRDQSLLAPTPFFYGFRENIICDTPDANTVILADSDRTSRVNYPFDYSYNYDVCLRNTTPFESQICPLPPPSSCVDSIDRAYKLAVNPCSEICLSELTSTEEPSTTPGPFFKRTLHGGINMITNFCLQPICIFVGRYYKETFNRHSYKGVKLWYWIHFIGGGIASIFQYFGYFHPTWVQKTNPHYIAGNIMMLMLGITYASSWIRHKNNWATAAAEFFHGASGYCVSGLAFWCLHTAPDVSQTALILIYSATGLLGFGYIVMEGCICLLDHKFGMRPRRRHIPTVEARFDDLPVPQRGKRIAFLVFLTVIMFILTALTIIY